LRRTVAAAAGGIAAAARCGLAAAVLTAPLLVPAPALAQNDADFAAARAATARRDWAAALPLFARLVERDGDNADLLIEAARVHGWADRNADAARLYRRALAAAPARRADIVPSLAWQALWAGEFAAAAALFEESRALARGAAAAEPLDGLAQVRQALGDTDGAIAALREGLALRPGEAKLVQRLAAVLNDAGRHRAALRVLGSGPAAATEVDRYALARTWRWAGYEDRAAPLLAAQADAEATWLRDWRVARELRARAEVDLEHSVDRDGLTSNAWSLGGATVLEHQAALDFRARRVALEDPSFGSADVTQLEAGARWRFGEPTSAAGTLWPQLALRAHRSTHEGAQASGSWQSLLPVARLKWIPEDGWRIDAEAAREVVETPRALSNRVHLTSLSLGTDWRRDARLMLTGGIAAQRFDDGTQRLRTLARGEWAFSLRPRWALGLRALPLDRTADGAAGSETRGYWNPRRYREERLYLAFSHEPRPFDLEGRIGVAQARETDTSDNTSRATPALWELAAAVDFSATLRLRFSAGGSGGKGGLGAASGGSGYWRRWVAASLTGWF
jgi:tetratricopeptide (TPR) repeat protein